MKLLEKVAGKFTNDSAVIFANVNEYVFFKCQNIFVSKSSPSEKRMKQRNVNVLKRFSSSLAKKRNKLERLSLANLSSLS